MRIGFVTDNYKPYVSGVINFISLNRLYLERRGHEVWVFAFGGPGAGSTPEDPHVVLSPGVKVHGTAGFRVGPRFTREVHQLLTRMDVVHVDDPFWSGRLALSVCHRHGVPVVFTNHTRVDLYPDYFLKMFPEGSLDDALASYMRRFCRRVDLVISPTASVAEVLLSLGVDVPIRVIRNGVDIDAFLGMASRPGAREEARERRRELNVADDHVLFAYTGRLSVEKNLSLLLAAFAAVAEEAADTHLVFIGDGPYRPTLEEEVERASLSRRIRFAGMVAYEDMPAELALCDVWATASTTEVDPLTLIEAMAAGLPVVGPASPGIVDTVEDGVTGLLSQPDDSDSLAECMLALAIDPRLRRAIGDAAREASRRYSIEETGAELLGIYEEVVQQKATKTPITG